jgi:hypothetical protein
MDVFTLEGLQKEAVYSTSSWFEPLTTFQATGFETRCDEIAIGAHPLGAETPAVGIHPTQFTQRGDNRKNHRTSTHNQPMTGEKHA